MKILVILFALGVSARPQVGSSGVVSPDGNNRQFSHEFANSIVVVGPSGIVTSTGENLQLTHGEASLHARTARDLSGVNIESGALVGAAGVVNPSGHNHQFTREQVDDIVVAGPSGIVTKSGNNIQFPRRRRQANAGFTTAQGSVGIAGIVRQDGTIQAFTPEQMADIVLIGPGGIVTLSGNNYQLTSDLYPVRNKRDLRDLDIGADDVVGASGIVTADGRNIQFTPEQVHQIAVAGPSGIVFKDGRNMQFA